MKLTEIQRMQQLAGVQIDEVVHDTKDTQIAAADDAAFMKDPQKPHIAKNNSGSTTFYAVAYLGLSETILKFTQQNNVWTVKMIKSDTNPGDIGDFNKYVTQHVKFGEAKSVGHVAQEFENFVHKKEPELLYNIDLITADASELPDV